jgi:hypothetical protein
MDSTGEHHVVRIDDSVTAANLHASAEAVAVPDFDYLTQMVAAIAAGLTGTHHRGHHRSPEPPSTAHPETTDGADRTP